MLPPWLTGASERLQQARDTGRLPASLLIHEDVGAGGRALAEHVVQLVLCPEAAAPCGRCASCRRVQKAEHPDFHLVLPDPELKTDRISVDQVRAVGATLALSSYEGQGSCVVLAPADAMTREAANALLKTLEEPRPHAHLVLLTSQPSRLPATIRSRCLVLRARSPDRATALEWLQASRPAARGDWEAVLDVLGVAPLEALDHDPPTLRALRDDVVATVKDALGGRMDIVRVADRWTRDELPLRLRAVENCLTRLALEGGQGGRQGAEMRPGTHLSGGDPDINIATALRLIDDVRELQRQMAATGLNKPLAVERHLWRLSGARATA